MLSCYSSNRAHTSAGSPRVVRAGPSSITTPQPDSSTVSFPVSLVGLIGTRAFVGGRDSTGDNLWLGEMEQVLLWLGEMEQVLLWHYSLRSGPRHPGPTEARDPWRALLGSHGKGWG